VELPRLWSLVTDGICSKRLAPFLSELLDGCVGAKRSASFQSWSRHVSRR
jgi:hypothetical protein